MSSSNAAPAAPAPYVYTPADTLRWAALALVFGAAMLNYIDRQAIALLKPRLEEEFGWSDRDYAHIVSGFQIATIASIMAVGWFVDRVGLRIGYAIGVGAWSLAGMAHAAMTTVAHFIGIRAVLGVTEAVNLPAAVKTVATWFRGNDRSLALGVMNMAPNIGAVVAPLLVLWIAVAMGRKMAFVLTGAAGFIWLVFWLMLPKSPKSIPDAAHPETAGGDPVTIVRMLRDRRAWAIAVAKMLTDYVFAFMLFWAPDLFFKRYGIVDNALAQCVAAVFFMAAIGSLFGGTLSSILLRRGHSFNIARKTPMVVSALVALPVPLAMFADNPWITVLLVGGVLAAHQCFSTTVFGIATDLFPPRMVGLVAGFGATFGGLSGLAMNEFTGIVLDATGSYAPMLWLCALAYVTALTVLHLMLPNIDRAREKHVAS